MIIEMLQGEFSVCQLNEQAQMDWSHPFTFIARTDEELSLVCLTKCVPENVIRQENGWRAFRIQGTLDFSLVGILSRIADLLARENIPLFVISTYNTDYVLVREETWARTKNALLKNGYTLLNQ